MIFCRRFFNITLIQRIIQYHLINFRNGHIEHPLGLIQIDANTLNQFEIQNLLIDEIEKRASNLVSNRAGDISNKSNDAQKTSNVLTTSSFFPPNNHNQENIMARRKNNSFFNAWKKQAILVYGSKGLKVEDFTSNPSCYAFTEIHLDAIKYLVKKGFSPQESLKELVDLLEFVVINIPAFFRLGIDGNNLRSLIARNKGMPVSRGHLKALTLLIQDHSLDVVAAIGEIAGLSDYAANQFSYNGPKNKLN